MTHSGSAELSGGLLMTMMNESGEADREPSPRDPTPRHLLQSMRGAPERRGASPDVSSIPGRSLIPFYQQWRLQSWRDCSGTLWWEPYLPPPAIIRFLMHLAYSLRNRT